MSSTPEEGNIRSCRGGAHGVRIMARKLTAMMPLRLLGSNASVVQSQG
jgi:hypothetical protein